MDEGDSEAEQSGAGLARTLIARNFSVLPSSATNLLKGHILHLYITSGKSRTKTEEQLKDQYPNVILTNIINSRIKSAVTKTKKYKKLSNPREREKFLNICNESFNFTTQTSQELVPSTSQVNEKEPSSPALKCSPTSTFTVTTRSSSELTPRKEKLKRHLSFVSGQVPKYKEKVRSLSNKLKSVTPLRATNQALKRKKEQLKKKEAIIRKLKKRMSENESEELSAVKAELAKLKQAHLKLKKSKQKKRKKTIATVPLHEHRKIVRELQTEKEDLELMLQEKELDANDDAMVVYKKDKKIFSTSYRLSVYNCLLHQVPVEATGRLIKEIVQDITGKTVDAVADASTISQCAYELGILTDIQVGEAMDQEESLNIAWDATSLDAEHLNEVHVNCHAKSYVLQVDVLPGGTTNDYVQHICQALQDICNSYAEFKNIDPTYFYAALSKKVKSTLSDRASVNHCVRIALEAQMNVSLLELKCNVHPLDGLASEARKCLKSLDKESDVRGTVFGRESVVVNLIYGISKMRYKNGTGDPAGFKHFLKSNDIMPSMITRYVGNRIHVLFHLAGTIYYLREKLLMYLRTSCNCNTAFRTALLKDLSSPYVQLQLKALGLLGKLLTGPWMTVLYCNKSALSNLEVVPILKGCMEKVLYQ